MINHQEMLALCVQFDQQANEESRTALHELLLDWKQISSGLAETILAHGLAQVGIVGDAKQLLGWMSPLREFGALLRKGSWAVDFVSSLHHLSESEKPFTPESALHALSVEIEDFRTQIDVARQTLTENPETLAADIEKAIEASPALKARIAAKVAPALPVRKAKGN